MLSTTVYRVSHSKVDKVDWLWWGCMFEVFLVCPMCSWEVLYFAYFTSLKKYIYIGWPQQPLTQKVSDISEKLDFWWSIPQKGTGIGQLGARDDQTIRISIFFDEMRLSRSLRPLRLLRSLRSLRLQRF